jgi:hypothetical protein
MGNSEDNSGGLNRVTGSLFANRSARVTSVIGGLIAVAAAGLLILSAANAAGVVGSAIYSALFAGLGIGYWLVVALLLASSIPLLVGSYSLPRLTLTHVISGVLFLVSLLALIALGTFWKRSQSSPCLSYSMSLLI